MQAEGTSSSSCSSSSFCPSENLSPRPSSQHSKSIAAPPDCTNCSKQIANPINNYISKWKYKEDQAKPLNTTKRPRTRKQPQILYHFPLSHCTVNTSNPNIQSEAGDAADSASLPSSDTPSNNPPSPSSSSQKAISPRSCNRTQVPREVLLRQHLQQFEQYKQHSTSSSPSTTPRSDADDDEHMHDNEDDKLQQEQPDMESDASDKQDYFNYIQFVQRHHRLQEISLSEQRPSLHHPLPSSSPGGAPSPSSPRPIEISAICNPAPPSSSPRPSSSSSSSDVPDHKDPSILPIISSRAPRKRRLSEMSGPSDTIEISDGKIDTSKLVHTPAPLTCPRHPAPSSPSVSAIPDLTHTPPARIRSSASESLLLSQPSADRPADPLRYFLPASSAPSANNDIAKYHLSSPQKPSLPLPYSRFLPPIRELAPSWPIDDSNPILRQMESVKHHRSYSFGYM